MKRFIIIIIWILFFSFVNWIDLDSKIFATNDQVTKLKDEFNKKLIDQYKSFVWQKLKLLDNISLSISKSIVNWKKVWYNIDNLLSYQTQLQQLKINFLSVYDSLKTNWVKIVNKRNEIKMYNNQLISLWNLVKKELNNFKKFLLKKSKKSEK